MLPILSIVGRTNVGKSTLFNCLTKTRDALVADEPGVTRDRHYGLASLAGKAYILVDTGGFNKDNNPLEKLAVSQTEQAIADSDLVLLLMDGSVGLTALDEEITKNLRKSSKKIILVINKSDTKSFNKSQYDFHRLGFTQIVSISAAHNRGLSDLHALIDSINLPREAEADSVPEKSQRIKIAIVGKPNTGKSTLMNRILGEDRVVVYDQPGTTRDSIYVPFDRGRSHYTFIDTAGVRRRTKITDAVEKYSVSKTLQAIQDADLSILMIDSTVGITAHDLSLLSFIQEVGRSLIITLNKWDLTAPEDRVRFKGDVKHRLNFLPHAEITAISALHGSEVGNLFKLIDRSVQAASKIRKTSELNKLLMAAEKKHQPPLVRGHRIKLLYAHAGGYHPLRIVIHGHRVEKMPASYSKFLENFFHETLKLGASPLVLKFKEIKKRGT